MAISARKIRNNCNSCSWCRIETLYSYRKLDTIRRFSKADMSDLMIMNRISGCNGEELENLELRFDIFQQNIASHPVVQVEFILWFYHVKLQIDDQRILSLKSLWLVCVLAIERHPLNEEMIAADPNIKRSRARWWRWVVFTLGFIWCWNWFSKYCIIPM